MHRADRADQLVGALADVLAEPLDDPLEREVVAVHSRGIERWIAQELSARLGTGPLGDDGVCANVEFPFPARLVREAVARGSGLDPDEDPWLPERLTWPLIALVDEDPTAEMLGPLKAHADPAADSLARRLGAVRHVADLFDRYGVHRPDMILRWIDGDDVGPDLRRPLPARHGWQPAMFRAVHRRLAGELGIASFAERRAEAIASLREDRELVDLPDRVALFGLTALPATYLEVVAALARHRDVHLLLLHPSRDLWERVAAAADGPTGDAARPRGRWPRDLDPSTDAVRNPLLRSWGRDVREVQLVVPADPDTRVVHHAPTVPPSDRAPTLLERIQADVRDDRHPGPAGTRNEPVLDLEDRSVQVHDCHGRLRQVEVLRDAVLHLLAADDTLEPRDIIVMCPDIETFAPLVTAVFGADAVHDDQPGRRSSGAPPALRVRLADRSLRGTNPVLDVVADLLDLVESRVTASAVLDLVSRVPVRRRFGLGEEDVDTLERWIEALGIRWGLDAEHRRRHGLPELDAHTWRAGLERLLLGAAMADEDLRLVDGVAPFDGVEGQATDLAGRLAELVARLGEALGELTGARSLAGWRDAIGRAADRVASTGPDDAWQRSQLHRVLDDLVAEATLDGTPVEVELTLPELRTMLTDRLTGRPSRTSHRTGDLTFSTLVPMRSVPHRVVCLLGLDDGAFPRQTVTDSDDLLTEAPHVGDRDPRSEDRQLLLDALLAATETLVVTFAGRDERTNEPRPPAVPVDELLDTIDRTVASPDPERRPRDLVTVRHPLTEHDPRNFTPDALRHDGRPWGFHEEALAAARARREPAGDPPPFLAAPLPPLEQDVIELDDLVAFLQHPARAFARQRLDVSLPSDGDARSDAIPASLRALDAWKVGDPLLQHWLAGDDLDRATDVLRARGLIPPGDLARGDLEHVRGTVERIIGLCEGLGVAPGPRATHDIELELPDGRRLVGTVGGVDRDRPRITNVTYSAVKAKQRLAAWVRHLAVTAQHPGPWETLTVGRHDYGGKKHLPQAFVLPAREHEPDAARARVTTQLQRLVDLYDRGMRQPIPLFCDSSAKIAENLSRRNPPGRYLHFAWTSDRYKGFVKEDLDPYHLLALGGQLSTDELLDLPCIDAEERTWADDDRRVVAYAWRLWEPILASERRRQSSGR